MKQMRSRFRLITLLLVCAFLLILVLCAGNAFKTAGISFSSFSLSGVAASPVPHQAPDASDSVPVQSDTVPTENPLPDTDNLQQTEYNIFGL